MSKPTIYECPMCDCWFIAETKAQQHCSPACYEADRDTDYECDNEDGYYERDTDGVYEPDWDVDTQRAMDEGGGY